MWHVPTHVQIELTVDRVQFTVGQVEGGWKNLMGPLDVEAVIFSRFGRITMSPKSVEAADPKQYNAEDNTFPDRAWHRATLTQDSLHFVAGETALHPTVTIQADPPKSNIGHPTISRAGQLDAVRVVKGSTVILQRGGGAGASVTAEILADTPQANLTPTAIYWVMPHNTMVYGVSAAAGADSDRPAYRVVPKAGNPTVMVEGEAKALVITIVGMSGSGRRTGTTSTIIERVRRAIRKDPPAASIECSAVGPGSMDRASSGLRVGIGLHPRIGPSLSGSGAPRTFRNNLYALTLFPFLRSWFFVSHG